MRGITAAGVYIPRYRLETDELIDAWGTSHAASIEWKAVAAADEDALTMAIAASARALNDASIDRESVDLVATATTTPPLEEGEFTPQLVRALGLSNDVRTAISTQHTAAGAEALARALDTDGPALVTAADCPEGAPADDDHPLGGGAAAFIIDSDAAVEFRDTTWRTDEAPGIRFRQRGDRKTESLNITSYGRNVIREAVTQTISSLSVDLDTAAAVAIHQPDGKLPYRASSDLPIESEAVQAGTVVNRIGDAGAATVPIGLLSALAGASKDELSVAAFFGGGAASAFACVGGLSVRGIESLEGGVPVSYAEYLRKRGYVVSEEVAGGGAHVSLPNWRRSLDQRYRLIAGQCPECGGVTFPPTGACQVCHSRVEFEHFEAPRIGSIIALTTIGQGGAPPEFTEHQQRDGAYAVAIVAINANGGTLKIPAQIADVDFETVEVGDDVRATIRRIYTQEGIPRYGVKFTPIG